MVPEDPPVRWSGTGAARRRALDRIENLGFLFLACFALILGGLLVVRIAQGDTLAAARQDGPAEVAVADPASGALPEGDLPTDQVPQPESAGAVLSILPPTVPQDSSASAGPDGSPVPSPSPTPAPTPVPTPAPTPVATPVAVAASAAATVTVSGATDVDETGGEVELAFSVRNAGADPIVIVTLLAEPSGSLAGSVDCGPGTRLAGGADCRFTSTLSLPAGTAGSQLSVTFRAVVAPAGAVPASSPLAPQASSGAPQASLPTGSIEASTSFALTWRDVLPQVDVTADGPVGLPETSGSGTWQLTIRNSGSVAAMVDSITLAPFGQVSGAGCAKGTVLAEAETCTLQVTLRVPGGVGGGAMALTATVSAHDAQSNVAEATAGTSLTCTDVPPHVAITATGPSTVPAAGGTATLRVTVTNDGPVPATIARLAATPAGVTAGGCQAGSTLAADASCTAQVAVQLPAGDPASPATIDLFVVVTDHEGNQAAAVDTRSVGYAPAPAAPPAATGGTTATTTGSGPSGAGSADVLPPTDTVAGRHVVELSPVQLTVLGGAFVVTLLAMIVWLPRRRAAAPVRTSRIAATAAVTPAAPATGRPSCPRVTAARRTPTTPAAAAISSAIVVTTTITAAATRALSTTGAVAATRRPSRRVARLAATPGPGVPAGPDPGPPARHGQVRVQGSGSGGWAPKTGPGPFRGLVVGRVAGGRSTRAGLSPAWVQAGG